MCLLRGLVEGNSNIKPGEEFILSTESIAKYYAKWVSTGPFDIGMATRSALGPLTKNSEPATAKKSAF